VGIEDGDDLDRGAAVGLGGGPDVDTQASAIEKVRSISSIGLEAVARTRDAVYRG